MSDRGPVNGDAVALIGVDWGTSSLRVTAMDADGAILAEAASDRGILTVQATAFSAALTTALAPWSLPLTVPVMLSGMITSRNGWRETPYLTAPCQLDDLAQGLIRDQDDSGRRLYFVPGIQQLDQQGADVMRGEETELFGWLSRQIDHPPDERVFLLPGTHSKWVRAGRRGIESFKTCMTGEMFSLLCSHSILGRLMTTGHEGRPEAFAEGARRGLAEPQSLLSLIFSARAMPLLEVLAAEDIRHYLAGLLIGAEVGAQTFTDTSPVVVIGRGDLTDRYCLVLEMAGQLAEKAQPGAASAGQFELARRAGLL